MLKKIIVAILLISVIGAGGAAFAYQAASPKEEVVSTAPQPLASGNSAANSAATENGAAQPAGAPQNDGSGPVVNAHGTEGEPWQAAGTIVALDDNGFDFTTESGESVYIELGPSSYWQSQGIELQAGQQVTVVGTVNEGMIHANEVQLSETQALQLRSESGQPLWSGGASDDHGQGAGQSAGQSDGDHVPDPQAQVDEWVTIQGTLVSFQGGSMTMATDDGELIVFQTGQPRFFADQGITFQVGEEIIVVGFYEGEQFTAGEITQVATGLRVMLRDPNGRPLWAGPGSGEGGGNGGGGGNGNGNGNGNSRGNGGGNH